jgi:hypothetical protein
MLHECLQINAILQLVTTWKNNVLTIKMDLLTGKHDAMELEHLTQFRKVNDEEVSIYINAVSDVLTPDRGLVTMATHCMFIVNNESFYNVSKVHDITLSIAYSYIPDIHMMMNNDYLYSSSSNDNEMYSIVHDVYKPTPDTHIIIKPKTYISMEQHDREIMSLIKCCNRYKAAIKVMKSASSPDKLSFKQIARTTF